MDTAASIGEGSVYPLVRELGQRWLNQMAHVDVEIREPDKSLRQLCRNNESASIAAFAPMRRLASSTPWQLELRAQALALIATRCRDPPVSPPASEGSVK